MRVFECRKGQALEMKLLLADDDPITLDALHACAAPEGFTTLLARDGREALALWEKHRPDLCCLDIMMPHIDGYEVLRRIRAADACVPVLFLSAKSEEIDVVVGLQLGADDFIRKPFGKHELLARLRAVLRRAQGRGPAARSIALRDLTVWPLELRAERAGVSIDLSPREAAILNLLHERAGEVVDRDALLNRCWGAEYYPESRTLDQHIAKLRKRVEADPANPTLIETVRGVGYRYRPQAG
jgi:DNA-binding response OmpR family regulator